MNDIRWSALPRPVEMRKIERDHVDTGCQQRPATARCPRRSSDTRARPTGWRHRARTYRRPPPWRGRESAGDGHSRRGEIHRVRLGFSAASLLAGSQEHRPGVGHQQGVVRVDGVGVARHGGVAHHHLGSRVLQDTAERRRVVRSRSPDRVPTPGVGLVRGGSLGDRWANEDTAERRGLVLDRHGVDGTRRGRSRPAELNGRRRGLRRGRPVVSAVVSVVPVVAVVSAVVVPVVSAVVVPVVSAVVVPVVSAVVVPVVSAVVVPVVSAVVVPVVSAVADRFRDARSPRGDLRAGRADPSRRIPPMVLAEPVAVVAVITVAHQILTVVAAVMVAAAEATGGETTRLGARSGAARIAMASATATTTVRAARSASATAAGRGTRAPGGPSATTASAGGRTTRGRGCREDRVERDRLGGCATAEATEHGARNGHRARRRDRGCRCGRGRGRCRRAARR